MLFLENNGSPSIEINFGSSNDDKNETFTFLPKKSLFMMSSKEASILQKEYSFKCPDQEFIRNKKFNFMEIILYNAFHESNPCQLGLCYFIVFIKKEDSAKPSTPKNFLIENKLLLKGAGAAANFEKNTNFKKER